MTEEKLYIIGGSGFVGKNMVRCLHEKYAISVFDKYIDKAYFAAYLDVKCYQIELDKEHISHDIPSPDYIINLASIVTAERDLSLFDAMIQSNLKVLLNLYERFKEDKSLKYNSVNNLIGINISFNYMNKNYSIKTLYSVWKQ